MSTASLSLILLVLYVVTGYLIAKYRGSKRRIGFRWTLFFSIFFSPIAGYLFTSLSPLLSKVPPNDPKDKTGNILLCILGCLWALYTAGTETDPVMMMLSVIGPIGFVYYIATRSRRNNRVYQQFVHSQEASNSSTGPGAAGQLLPL